MPVRRLVAVAQACGFSGGGALRGCVTHVAEARPGRSEAVARGVARGAGRIGLWGSVDRLAGFAGLAPQPRDSGRVSGNLRRPRRYHRGLLRTMYLSALASLKSCPASKAYYQRKRNEGKGHKQALLALARRRVNVLWAMIRDRERYHASPPVAGSA